MDIFINTAAADINDATVTSLTDSTQVTDFKQLVLGDSEPLTLYFMDGSAAEAWSGDATYTPVLSLGPPDALGDSLSTSSNFTAITDGWSGRMSVATTILYDYCYRAQLANRNIRSVVLNLQARVTDPNGNQETFALINIVVSFGPLPTTPPDDSAVNFATYVQVQAEAAAAAASAAAALVSENAAAASETAAGLSETNAAASEAAAGVSETNAAASAADALTQAGNSSTSAAASAASAVTAGISETAAAASEAAAGVSETNAAASESAAATSETNAATSETNAAASEAAAAVSETAALASQVAAASSAADASASATAAANALAAFYISTIAGGSVPATATAAGYFYLISSVGTSQSITWAVGDMAIYDGTSGNWTKLATSAYGFAIDATVQSEFAARAARQAVISDGTGGISTGPVLDLSAVSGITILGFISPADITPSGTQAIASNYTGSNGVALYLRTTGALQLVISGTTYVSTELWAPAAGATGLGAVSINLAGNAVFSVGGVQLGDAIDVSAKSASDLDTSTAQTWGSSEGTGFWVGGIGECGISTDIGTLAQLASIQANGTAVGSGLTMLQHIVPQIAGQSDVLLEDVSGNINHAVLGASGLSWVHEPFLPTRTVTQGLRGDGSNGAQIDAVLNDQNPAGAGPFAVRVNAHMPDNRTTTRILAAITDDVTSIIQDGSFYVGFTVNYGLTAQLRVSSGNELIKSSVALYDKIKDTDAQIVVGRGSGGFFAFLEPAGGGVYDVTNLFINDNNGSPGTWATVTANGTHWTSLARSSTNATAATIYALDLFNLAPTNTTEAAEMMGDIVPAKWAKGDNAAVITDSARNEDFAEATSDWVVIGSAVGVTINTTQTAGSLFYYTSGTGTDTRYFGLDPATYWSAIPAIGTELVLKITATSVHSDLRVEMLDSSNSTTGLLALSDVELGENIYRFTVGAVIGASKFRFRTNTVGTTYLSRVEINRGLTTSLDLSDGGGYQPKNTRAENGSEHFEMSTTGVEWVNAASEGKRISITKTFTESEISTTSSTTELGTLPPGWSLRELQVSRAVAFDASTTLAVGTSSGSTLFVSAQSLASTGFSMTDSSRKDPQSSTANTSIYIKKNQATTTGTVTITVFLERSF